LYIVLVILKQLFSLQKISVSVCISLLPYALNAGDPTYSPAGAAEAGMAYVSVMKTGVWSSFHNQASLAFAGSPSAGINYENRFGLKELGTSSAAVIIPSGRAVIGAVYSRFGSSDYRRHMAGLACGMHLSESFSAGVQVDYLCEKVYGEYNDIQFVTFEAGLLVKAGEKVNLGLAIFNPLPYSFRKNRMASTLRIGAGTRIGNGLFAGAEAEMSTGGTTDLRTGFEYEAGKSLVIRGGFRTKGSSFSFGLGYLVRQAAIDIAFNTHEKLGVTSSVSLIFKL
jgi:hypothetical protein